MLIELQNTILKMVAQGDELEATMNELCRQVEHLLPGTIASILILDSEGLLHPLAAPSLPKTYSAALDGIAIGPDVGSCGSAAFIRQPVIVSDIERDPRWALFKALAAGDGLRACFSSPIFGSKGKVLGTFALYFSQAREPSLLEQSIVEGCLPLGMIALERHERLLEHHRLAFTDVLTGLANRAKFDDVLKRRNGTVGWSILLVDVDDLKTINDTFGHSAGDELIAIVSGRLASAVGWLACYRLGGDEFAVILDFATGEKLERIAAAITDSVGKPAVCSGNTVFPTVTIGGSLSSHDDSAAQTRRNADLALYHAKEVRRGGLVIHDATIVTAISRRSQAIQSVAQALKEERIEAWYQPVVRLNDQLIVGVEALARMRQQDGSIIPAAQFHEATKDARIAAALTRQMINSVARDLGNWMRAGISFGHVGINLSAADFARTDFPDSLVATFEQENIPLSNIILEITESVYLGGRNQRVVDKIAALRKAGFKVALDDFGTGFASLTHLINIPVDIIKIDKSFVDRLGPDDPGSCVVEGILHIANRLGLKVVAEGIEKQAQADFLVDRGCNLGQGFLFARALPADEIRWMLPALTSQREGIDGLVSRRHTTAG